MGDQPRPEVLTTSATPPRNTVQSAGAAGVSLSWAAVSQASTRKSTANGAASRRSVLVMALWPMIGSTLCTTANANTIVTVPQAGTRTPASPTNAVTASAISTRSSTS